MSKATATSLRGGLEERVWDRDTDYEMLAEWWRALPEWEPAPSQILPDTGLILSWSGEPVCAGFWYVMKNAPMAYLGWPIFSPECPLKVRPLAAATLLERLVDRALSAGAHQVVRNEGVAALRRIAEDKAGMAPNPAPVYTAYWTSGSERIVALED